MPSENIYTLMVLRLDPEAHHNWFLQMADDCVCVCKSCFKLFLNKYKCLKVLTVSVNHMEQGKSFQQQETGLGSETSSLKVLIIKQICGHFSPLDIFKKKRQSDFELFVFQPIERQWVCFCFSLFRPTHSI